MIKPYEDFTLIAQITTIPTIAEIKNTQEYYIEANKELIAFFAKLFDYKYDDIINNLKAKDAENDTFEATNIGYLKDKDGTLKTYSSFEYGLIEYFYALNKAGDVARKVKYVPYTGDAKYVENLIIYFSSIYSNVDTTTLLSIGAAESGYYKVKFMLKYNNVYGGMGSRGLIKHNNIEQGVLSFVRLMSRNYYGKGLDTPEKIGRVYCPRIEGGVKKASSHWLKLVRNAKSKYEDYPDTIAFNELTGLETEEI